MGLCTGDAVKGAPPGGVAPGHATRQPRRDRPAKPVSDVDSLGMMETPSGRWRGGGDTAMTGSTQTPAPGRIISVQASSHQIPADHRPMVSHSGRPVTAGVLVVWAIQPVTAAHRVTGQHRRPEARAMLGGVAAFGAGAVRPPHPRAAGGALATGTRGIGATGLGARSVSPSSHRASPFPARQFTQKRATIDICQEWEFIRLFR
jgi:hypothetical protein